MGQKIIIYIIVPLTLFLNWALANKDALHIDGFSSNKDTLNHVTEILNEKKAFQKTVRLASNRDTLSMLLKLSSNKDTLIVTSKLSTYKSKSKNQKIAFYLGVVAALAAILTYIINFAQPYVRYQSMSEMRWDALKDIADSLFQNYEQYDFSYNIMIPKRIWPFRGHWFTWREPEKPGDDELKWSINKVFMKWRWRKVFEVVWTHGNLGVHKEFIITTHQGVSGKAYREGVKTSIDYILSISMKPHPPELYNLTKKQLNMSEHLTVLISCPIVIEKKTAKKLNYKVIGVLNMYSSADGAKEFLKKDLKIPSDKIIENSAQKELDSPSINKEGISNSKSLSESETARIEELQTKIKERNGFYDKVVYMARVYSKMHT